MRVHYCGDQCSDSVKSFLVWNSGLAFVMVDLSARMIVVLVVAHSIHTGGCLSIRVASVQR